LRNVVKWGKYSLAKFAIFSHCALQTGNCIPNTRIGCQFPVCNTKWLKNGKLRKAISSTFYNISQRNFGILLILWCSFKLWWNFCLDRNFSYKGKGPLVLGKVLHIIMVRSNDDPFSECSIVFSLFWTAADKNDLIKQCPCPMLTWAIMFVFWEHVKPCIMFDWLRTHDLLR
jgi:hypothetical protein